MSSDFRKCKAVMMVMLNNTRITGLGWDTRNHVFECEPTTNIAYCCKISGRMTLEYTCNICNSTVHHCDYCDYIGRSTRYFCFIGSHWIQSSICHKCVSSGNLTCDSGTRCEGCERIACGSHMVGDRCTSC
jgi:hypothetical protein